MPRLTNIIIAYFVIGSLMFGGGAVSWDNSGVTQYFIDQTPNGIEANNSPTEKLSGLAGAITSLVGQFGGGIVLVWNLAAGIISFVNWPIFVLLDNHAPPRVVILLGGTLTASFYMSVITMVKSSA